MLCCVCYTWVVTATQMRTSGKRQKVKLAITRLFVLALFFPFVCRLPFFLSAPAFTHLRRSACVWGSDLSHSRQLHFTWRSMRLLCCFATLSAGFELRNPIGPIDPSIDEYHPGSIELRAQGRASQPRSLPRSIDFVADDTQEEAASDHRSTIALLRARHFSYQCQHHHQRRRRRHPPPRPPPPNGTTSIGWRSVRG